MAPSNDEVKSAQEAAKAYKESSEDKAGPSTVFDNILSKKWPSEAVYEDDKAYAFRDITPQAPTHILVIPKVRDGLVQLSKAREDQKELLGHLMFVAQEVGKKECPDGFRVVINDGEHGAQSVYHLHLHVLGGRQLQWPPG
jgi:histidine triad (HIT) family protein